ncbi:MAG: SPASM domain-containing protein [Candidatus Pacearchaeota archaeon]|nr:MAG: SPASM domain-containing protein [Candidatus Pacearchaeota archaeon]
MKFKLFRNLYFKKVNSDYWGVYHPFNEYKIIFISSDLKAELKKFQNSGEILENNPFKNELEKLKKEYFLVPELFNHTKPIQTIREGLPKKPSIGLLYLLLTDSCNLNCSYCAIEENLESLCKNSKLRAKNMSIKTCDNAIDFYVMCKDDKLPEHRVIFYGGEPLLNEKVFRHAVSRLRSEEKKGNLKNLGMVMNTNATKVNEEIAEFFAKNKISPAVSLDGYKEIHDSQRKNLRGKGSYDETIRGYKLFQKHGIQPGISCTITKNNIGKLEEIAEFFVDNLNPNGIGFNLLLDFKDKINPLAVSVKKATKAMLKSFEFLREKGVFEERVMRRLGKIIKKEMHLKDCAGYGRQVVVAPDGRIGPCQIAMAADYPSPGNVNDSKMFDPNDNELFLEWNKRTAFNMSQCEDCSFITICGGGCAYQSYIKTGNIWQVDKRICEHCKELIDWVIDDLWKTKQKNIQYETRLG